MALQTVNFTSGTSWTPPTRAYIINTLFLVGGGGGGGYNGGGGGGGGKITIASNYTVTPGTPVTYAIGSSGAASSGGVGGTGGSTTFGALTAAGGTGGGPGGTSGSNYGGNSGINYLGTVSTYLGGTGNGDSGAGGASPGGNGNPSLGNGASGYSWNGSFYGGAGGGGCGTFTNTSVRPIPGAPGGSGGGGAGGGEGQAGGAGSANTGGGGGGGARAGTGVTLTSPAVSGGVAPGATYVAVAAQQGGAGGTGFIQIQYNEAEATLTTSNPGVAEGGSIIVNLATRNIPNGVVLGYTLSGPGITASNFSPASTTGSFTVVSTDGGISGSASTTITMATSGATSGNYTVTVSLNNGIASTTYNVGDLYQFAIPAAVDASGYLVPGRTYTIIAAGNTDFTALGSANNTAGTTFTATGTGMFFAGEFVPGRIYTIANPGNTDFVSIGAANNNVGTTFTATNSGFLTATSCISGQRYTIITLGNTDYTTFGAGWIGAGAFQVGASYIIKQQGTTDFTTIGASSNTVGTVFVALGGGAGNGYALPVGYTVNTGSSFTARASGTGTGTVMQVTSAYLGSAIGWASQGTGTVVGTWIPKSIQVADYNDIQTKVATILGTGSGNSGYGQTVLSSQVSLSSSVTVTGWNNLRYDIINAYLHQVGTPPTLSIPVFGDTIKANIQTAPYAQYSTWADTLVAQKFNVGTGQYITRSTPSTGVGTWYAETAWPGALGSSWNTRIYALVTVAWTTAAQARAFFNSAGEIRFRSARTGGAGAFVQQSAAWATLLTTSGTQGFGGNKPDKDTGALTGGNFYRLNSGFQLWYQNNSVTPYSANKYNIYARTPGVSDNSTGTAKSVEFQIEWLDDHASVGGSPDGVDGTFALWVSTLEASGTMVGGAGTFAVASPTIAITQAPTT